MSKLSLPLLSALALHNIATWRIVKKDAIGVAASWAFYFAAPYLLDAGLREWVPSWLMWLFTDLFWPTTISSVVTMITISLKTALPAMVALVAVLPLLAFSAGAAGISLGLAVLGFGLYAWMVYAHLRKQPHSQSQVPSQ